MTVVVATVATSVQFVMNVLTGVGRPPQRRVTVFDC